MYVCIYFYLKWAFLVGEENSKERDAPFTRAIFNSVFGTTWSRMFWKFLKDFTVHGFKQNKKRKEGGKPNSANTGCIAWEFLYPSEKHVPIIPGNQHLTDYICLFYLFITPRLQMCGRCTDSFSAIWGRKDWCWYPSNPHFSCLGAVGWTRPGSIYLHRLFCKHND